MPLRETQRERSELSSAPSAVARREREGERGSEEEGTRRNRAREKEKMVGAKDVDTHAHTRASPLTRVPQGAGRHHLVLRGGLNDRLPRVGRARHHKAKVEAPFCD